MSDDTQGSPQNAVGRATVPGAGRPASGSPQRGGPSSVASPANAPKKAGAPVGSTGAATGKASVPVAPATASATTSATTSAPSTSSGPTSSGRATVGAAPVGAAAAQASRPPAAEATKTIPAAASAARAQVSDAVRSARNTVTAAVGRGPRRAKLQLKRIDPWSVMKFSAAASLVLFLVLVVATSVLYGVLQGMGVFDSVNSLVRQLTAGTDGTKGLDLGITAGSVIGGSAILGAVNMFLFTALSTLSAFVYNVCADLVGGIEVTLAERD